MRNGLRVGLFASLLAGVMAAALLLGRAPSPVAREGALSPPAIRAAPQPPLATLATPGRSPAPAARPRAHALLAAPAEHLHLAMAEGVEGGAPGGVVGGVVGGLPSPVRVGGALPLARDTGIDRRRSDFNTEAYDPRRDNPFLAVATNPLSTFSIDVDTASYANVRRFLTSGQLPPKDAVRIEELVNYFRYDYPEPSGDAPFSVTTEVGACPWKPEHRLALVGLRGRSLEEAKVPPRRLTFLLDVSGSMTSPNKLPLLKEAMGLLVEALREQDRLAIVVYAGSAGLVLPPTSGDRKAEIREALSSLEAGGSTAGGEGIHLAYRVAGDMHLPGGVNRVILATDGDFNIGVTSLGDLARLIEEKRDRGVFLSVLGFGEGNLKDATMEMLADRGNGNYSYIDSLSEARKVLVSEAGGTLVTIAKDVKVQVEFNPRRIAAYRLVGYENRLLRAEDFADDGKDAGEIGAGHTVTALYELVPAGVPVALPGVDPLKYQQGPTLSPAAASGELMTVKLRYKEPEGDTSRLVATTVSGSGDLPGSERLRFSAAVAAFGLLLRDSEHKGAATWPMVLELARGAVGPDREGYRTRFVELAAEAERLSGQRRAAIAR